MSELPIVLVVGSLHYDVVVAAPHRPAAGETVQGSRWQPKFGGKGGNQAVAAARAGGRVRMLGAVGDDGFGAYLREGLRRGGVDDAFVATLAGQGSGLSVAISEPSGDYGAVIVSGANLGIDPDTLASEALWHRVAVLVLQNEVPEALNLAAAEAARGRGIPVCLNAAPYRPLPDALARRVDVLVANAIEAEALAGVPVASLAGAEAAARCLAGRFPTAVVTAGKAGVAVAERGGAGFALPAERVTPKSTHGAGDVFTGSLATALVAGAPLREAAETANRRAAWHVAGES